MRARGNEALEYTVSPTIENQPVAVELDRGRQQQQRRWLLLGLLVVAACLFNGWQRGQQLHRGYNLAEVQKQRAAELSETRNLLLELYSLQSPAYVEDYAARRLHLVKPSAADAFVLERVVPQDQLPSSVVASR